MSERRPAEDPCVLLVRRAKDAEVALDRLGVEHRALAIRAALAIARRALAQAAPRPRRFVNLEAEETWLDGDVVAVDEALVVVEELAAAIAAGDAARAETARARGEDVLARTEALEEAISAAADAFDYDAGAVAVGVASALLRATIVGDLTLGHVAWRAAWLVPCPDEASLPSDPGVWDERRRRRLVALRDVVLASVRAA